MKQPNYLSQLWLDQSDIEIRQNADRLLEINNQMRKEMRLKISAIVKQSQNDSNMELTEIFARGNREAKRLANEACKKNWLKDM